MEDWEYVSSLVPITLVRSMLLGCQTQNLYGRPSFLLYRSQLAQDAIGMNQVKVRKW